ncbi:MAG TPA: phytanoyl-CoA dioxygenase family protein [Hyphomonadaceae bacterium]|nr:phytanoyl-CoA dioxygenase family protein [Hyphomonadaceae bacterium]
MPVAHPFDQTLEHFRSRGFVRVPQSFSAGEAAAMRAAIWNELAKAGIREANPATWTQERPQHLQDLKSDPVFGAAWGPRTMAMVAEIAEGETWPPPRRWGAFFLAFPGKAHWNVPSSGWHTDANYTSALSPPAGIRLHALMGDVAPHSGGTLFIAGSHTLIHRWFKANPPPPGARGADHRKSLLGHPYIRDLHAEGDTAERIARFIDRAETHDGVELQVVENVGQAGDVLLAHPLLFHVATPNVGNAPRFLLSGAMDHASMWATV